MTYEEAILYIKKVISKWKAFGKAHKPFIKAWEVILSKIDEGESNEYKQYSTRTEIS